MRMINGRHVFATLAIGGFAAGSALFGSGMATADAIDDITPLLTTTCSFPQIEKALREVDPAAAQRLETNPVNSAALQFMISQPVQLRQSMAQQITNGRMKLKSATGIPTELSAFKSEAGPVLSKTTAVCHKY